MVGIAWRPRMTTGMRVFLSSPVGKTETLCCLPCFRTELVMHGEKALFDTIVGLRDVGNSQGVGVWFLHGLDPIAISIKMGYTHLASLHGVAEIWEPKKWSFWPKWSMIRPNDSPDEPFRPKCPNFGFPDLQCHMHYPLLFMVCSTT